MSKNKSVAVALSGGTDSTAAALLLREEGYRITGVTARFTDTLRGAPGMKDLTEEMVARAEDTARQLDIPFEVVDLHNEFYQDVITPFCHAYLKGLTPNPCIDCNRYFKFGKLLDAIITKGFDFVATGHYARVHQGNNGLWLQRGKDPLKDQSYFLYTLPEETLTKTLFPLGTYTKDEIRALLQSAGVTAHQSEESQEICFVPDGDYAAFIERELQLCPLPGAIVDADGHVIGQHRGIYRYTPGQRRGLGISAPHPLYVTGVDAAHNRVMAGYKEESLAMGLVATIENRMKYPSLHGMHLRIKSRASQQPLPARIHEEDNRFRVFFDTPLSGVSPGQSLVIYDDDDSVLGGGYILSSF